MRIIPTSDEDDMMAEMEFFLMFICHQPYSELEKIPFLKVQPWIKVFNAWITRLFGKNGSHSKLKKLVTDIDPRAFEEMWKAELEKEESEEK